MKDKPHVFLTEFGRGKEKDWTTGVPKKNTDRSLSDFCFCPSYLYPYDFWTFGFLLSECKNFKIYTGK